MVVSTTKQLPNTYNLWQRFSFSTDDRSWDAVAVPSWVGDKLNSAYTFIISLALVQFWTIVLSLILFIALRKYKNDASKLDPLAVTLWNKRGDLVNSVTEMLGFRGADWTRPWLLISIFIAVAAGVAKTAVTIIVAPLIIIDHAAPVNPAAVYTPDDTLMDNKTQAARFALEVPRFFRALGSAVVDDELRQKVKVGRAEPLGQTENGEDILRVDYSYGATGADLGIQKYFDLTFNVTGSCVTEYGWFQDSFPSTEIGAIDQYIIPFADDVQYTSIVDGRQPSATFYLGSQTRGTLDESNTTWGALVSSVDRTSFSVGTDPWYLTASISSNDTGAGYTVRPGRPGISCWEDAVWSYHGHNSTTIALTSDQLPGLGLSDSLQTMLAQYLGTPMVQQVGYHLQSSALMSAITSLDQIFDAGASSLHDDLERLVLTAYVVTINCLTDTTLYPITAVGTVPNIAIGDRGVVPGDLGYVVWSPDVATLSTLVIIAIPTILVGVWLIAIILIYLTPIKIVAVLDSSSLQEGRKPDGEEDSRPTANTAVKDVEGAKQSEKQ
ncbi:hypothetical protein O1611_g2811 [Lasiodiplodia mahajangana]|uniref:Uncharacterized protein n=1 Tax=Lasiodiplodia mahajangana TaxID=1108764 RepID=A0ACC2JU26_9PEZI|nr:hypothetical protein O1611_g2811 [Lasiodiplodia mahajangana]